VNDIRAGGALTKVLVVDDTALNRELLSAMLKKMGYQPIQAVDGNQALELFDQIHPDMVLMDVQMPGISGYDAVREMRRRAEVWIPIIFISANTSNESVVEGMRSGGDDYLFKPFNYEILHSKVDSLLARKEMSGQIVEQNKLLLDFKERIDEERDTAMHLISQFSALEKINDPLVRFHLQAAEQFSGDLISVARTPDNRLHVLLADSAGHGLTAALAVIPLTQPFHQMTMKGFDLPAIVSEINKRVRDYLRLPRFVSAILISIDAERRMIQVWNGGCPPVLLLNQDNVAVMHSFVSRHLPFGVLMPDEFDNSIEHYIYGNAPARLLLCSDGVSELHDTVTGAPHGLQGLLRKVQKSGQAQTFDALLDIIMHELGDDPLPDDLALMQVECPLVDEAAEHVENHTLVRQINEGNACKFSESVVSEWEFGVTLCAQQIKRMDIVPFLLGITGQIEGRQSGGKLFLVLSELFNNALDHGLLKLDSKLKAGEDGMGRYFDERATRLKALEQGEIEIRLSKLTNAACATCDKNCQFELLKIYFRDTGSGFDYAKASVNTLNENQQRHGRGIHLINSMCSVVQYLGNGSEVIAYLDRLEE